MATVNEALLDEAIQHQVDLVRYTNGVVRRMMGVLNRTDVRLFDELTAALTRLPAESFTVQRMEALLGSVRALNAQAHAQVGAELRKELQDFIVYEAAYQQKLLESVMPVQVTVAGVTAEQVYAAALARPFQGALLQGFLADLEADKAKKIRQAVAQGYVEGRPTGDIVRELRGTRARGFGDGIIAITRRNAEAVIRTAMSHMAGFTRDRFHEANDSLIKEISWTATLDGRTTPTCRVRDGKRYANVTHKPIGHNFPWLGGPGRAHWSCRSTGVPIVKSFRELGLEIDDFTPSTRASMDGQVPATLTYGEWLKKQKPAAQDEILGKDKGALYRTGKLPLDKFQDDKGKTLTLEQLKAKEPAAYHRAGLDLPYRPPRGERQDAIALFLRSQPAQEKLLTTLYTGAGLNYPANLAKAQAVKAAEGYTSTDESLAAVRYYTGSGYRPINKRMREGAGTLEDRQYMALTVHSFPGIGEFKGEIWRAPTQKADRANHWWNTAEVGKPLDMGRQLQSFSKEGRFAEVWAGSADVLLRVKSNKMGVYIDPLSMNQGEHEVLLPPGLAYRVVAKTTETRHGRQFRVIDLEIEK